MPVSIQVEQDTGIAIATCSGSLGADDAKAGATALWKSAGWPGKAAVWDLREAEFDVSSSDPQEIAQFILKNQPTPPPSKIAFVTKRDLEFGMARMFEAYRRDPGTTIRVFRDYDEAILWCRDLGPLAT